MPGTRRPSPISGGCAGWGSTACRSSERVFGEGTHLRPPLIQILGGRRVLLSGYTATHSPFWVNHLVYIEHATVRGIRVDSRFPNNDGVDVDSSRYVLVENSTFRPGTTPSSSSPDATSTAARSAGPASTSWCATTTWAARTASRWAARCRATSATCSSPTTCCARARRRSASRPTWTAAARSSTSGSGTSRSAPSSASSGSSSTIPASWAATSLDLPRHRVRELRGRERRHPVRSARAAQAPLADVILRNVRVASAKEITVLENVQTSASTA